MIIHHHLGLGDHIICNGLIRLLTQNNKVDIFCKHQNIFNLKTMYHNFSNLSIIGVSGDLEAEKIAKNHSDYIKLGICLNSNYPQNIQWDEIFYYQANIPYNYSWSYFKYYKPITQNKVPSEQYVFLCNKGSDGIDRLDYSIIDPNLYKVYSHNGNFFDNIDLIENAQEIHCINSSYIHLIDRIQTKSNTKLVYHKNFKCKPFSDFTLKKDWIVI